MVSARKVLTLALAGGAGVLAQAVYVPVNAPAAQRLVVETERAHPELQKLGLHAVPPGQSEYAIIANTFPSKTGKKSSLADLAVLSSGKATVKNDDRGKFFDLCLPISDAGGHSIGITVMEIPYSHAKDSAEALAKATIVRDEMEKKIAGRTQLFEETTEPLTLMETVSLPEAVKGHFDHFGVDLKHSRLFATPEDYHGVLVLDLVTGKLLATISGISKPHAVLHREDLDRLFVTDGEDGALKMFQGSSYQPAGRIALEKDADSIGYDPSRQYLYVVNGGKDAGQSDSRVSVIDTTEGKKVTEIRVQGDTLDAVSPDLFRPRLYVNNPRGMRWP